MNHDAGSGSLHGNCCSFPSFSCLLRNDIFHVDIVYKFRMCADSCILLYSPLTLSRTLDPCLLCGSNFLLSCYITCCLLLLLLGMASCYWNFSFLTCTAIQMVTPSSSTQPEKFESFWTCLEDNEEDLMELCITSVIPSLQLQNRFGNKELNSPVACIWFF